MSETTLQRLSREAEEDPLSNAAFEIWFMQQGFPGRDKMAAAYSWREARERAEKRAACAASLIERIARIVGCLPSAFPDANEHILEAVERLVVRRSCAFCEYFDGGGLGRVQEARAGVKIHGDCLNRESPRFTTVSDDVCVKFQPDALSKGGKG